MIRYTFDTDAQYMQAWKHCMIVGIDFYYCQSERWVESEEFDDLDEAIFTDIEEDA